MRDPNRLYKFYAELQRIHIQYFPDWRFGQFMTNFFGIVDFGIADSDPFFWEEDECLEKLRAFVGESNEIS